MNCSARYSIQTYFHPSNPLTIQQLLNLFSRVYTINGHKTAKDLIGTYPKTLVFNAKTLI